MLQKLNIYIFLLLFLVACGSSTDSNIESVVSQVDDAQVQFGELQKTEGFTYAPVIREEISVWNCNNPVQRNDKLIEVKTLSRVVSWEIEGELGVEGKAGIIAADASVRAAITSGYQLEIDDEIERGREIDLAVAPYSSAVYIIEWKPVIWSGYLPFEMASGSDRLEYEYQKIAFGEVVDRIDVTSEKCEISSTVPTPTPTPVPPTPVSPTPVPPAPVPVVNGIPRQTVNDWDVGFTNYDAVWDIIYNQIHPHSGKISFYEGDTIPKGVLITSDLGINWDRYPLKRLAHGGGGWGVFESLNSFVVLHADDLAGNVGGEYWYINE